MGVCRGSVGNLWDNEKEKGNSWLGCTLISLPWLLTCYSTLKGHDLAGYPDILQGYLGSPCPLCLDTPASKHGIEGM